jgi:hypothetical protein
MPPALFKCNNAAAIEARRNATSSSGGTGGGASASSAACRGGAAGWRVHSSMLQGMRRAPIYAYMIHICCCAALDSEQSQ